MKRSKFMWVSDGPDKKQENLKEIRKHVMQNFVAREGSGARAPRGPRKRRPVAIKVEKSQSLPEPSPTNLASIPPTPTLSNALTIPEDLQICNAAHFYMNYNPFREMGATSMNWCSRRWECLSASMWDSACENEAMREVFMMTAAVKESQVTGIDTTKSRLLHQGNAIRLVSSQLSRPSVDLNLAAIILMSILSKDAFATHEYGVAEAHMKAIATLIHDRMDTAPWFLWYFIVWTDLTQSGVINRPPRLPYFVPAELKVPLSQEHEAETARLARQNVNLIALNDHLTEELAIRLFEGLHKSAVIYNKDDTDWRAASMIYYETSWLCANSQIFDDIKIPSDYEPGRSEVNVMLRIIQMVMYGTASPFFSEAGPQSLLQKQALKHLRTCTPSIACDRWESVAALESLVWVLFNISISVICYSSEESTLAKDRRTWLKECLTICIRRLEAKCDTFSWMDCVKSFPFTSTWHGRWIRPFYFWFENDTLLDTAALRQIPAPFSNNWKVFTPPTDRVTELHDIIGT
ncbi:Hypothetical protein R9X50_00682800 [Acrodontium crateriforme]|uniref:Uncharacterized protein n=1 Tax=Acrodontium crateriforme TaxID=150365 RepID=A0AAQ3RCD7_9PEZI|nr:Hypothetical protein R9X50_00682800 [Acrodontium crateriforme]